MKIATCHLVSVSPYSQSRQYERDANAGKPKDEKADAYDKRMFRAHCHTNRDGNVLIPPMAFKQALDKAASMMGQKIAGKGNATYTKFFVSGVLVMDPLVLPVKADDVDYDDIYANATGKRGAGTRVWRRFPKVSEWSGDVAYTVLADEITKEVFEEAVRKSGAFVGIGRFRPENGGFYGRFSVKSITWN